MLEISFGLGNLLGLIAISYGILLAFSSNDLSQKFLGGSAWKFFQQMAYIFWVLVLLHTAYFLYFHFLDSHKSFPEPSWLQIPFFILVTMIIFFRVVAYIKTVKRKRKQKIQDFNS